MNRFRHGALCVLHPHVWPRSTDQYGTRDATHALRKTRCTPREATQELQHMGHNVGDTSNF